MPDEPILTTADFPTPAATAREPGLQGSELVLADGRMWTLADHVPEHGAVWDRLYDDNLVAGRYELVDLLLASARLLLAHYDLPHDFAAWLLLRVEPDRLVEVVEAALFGRPRELLVWSDWCDSSLWANGIDPATIPPKKLRHVLTQLVASGRAIPAHQFTSSGIAAAKRRSLADSFAAAGINPSKPPEASPPS